MQESVHEWPLCWESEGQMEQTRQSIMNRNQTSASECSNEI